MKKNLWKRMIAGAVFLVLFVSVGFAVHARTPHTKTEIDVGSTQVTLEVGYTGTQGYAMVTALDYVDVRMSGSITYKDGSSKEIDKYFSHSADQTKYTDVSCYGSGDVIFVECTFFITSADGERTSYLSR